MPSGVVTVTATIPVERAGATAFNSVADTNVTVADETVPNLAVAPDAKFVPVIVTVFPPAIGPAAGVTAVTVGGGPYLYRSAEDVALVPPGVVTVTSTVPTEPAGATAFNSVADTNVTVADESVPNLAVAPDAKFVPVIVTVFPPAVGPAVGLTAVTVGGES